MKSKELLLYKKGNRYLIMISKFLLEKYSQFKLNNQQIQKNAFISKEVCIYLQPDKNQNRYWTNEYLIN